MAFRRRLFSHNPFYDLYNSGKSIGLPPHTGCRLKPCARRSSAPAVRTPVRRRPRAAAALKRRRPGFNAVLAAAPQRRYAAVGPPQGPRRLLPVPISYDRIRKNPKAICPYSESRTLQNAIRCKSGRITLHIQTESTRTNHRRTGALWSAAHRKSFPKQGSIMIFDRNLTEFPTMVHRDIYMRALRLVPPEVSLAAMEKTEPATAASGREFYHFIYELYGDMYCNPESYGMTPGAYEAFAASRNWSHIRLRVKDACAYYDLSEAQITSYMKFIYETALHCHISDGCCYITYDDFESVKDLTRKTPVKTWRLLLPSKR